MLGMTPGEMWGGEGQGGGSSPLRILEIPL
jgi:hypothetical protein